MKASDPDFKKNVKYPSKLCKKGHSKQVSRVILQDLHLLQKIKIGWVDCIQNKAQQENGVERAIWRGIDSSGHCGRTRIVQ